MNVPEDRILIGIDFTRKSAVESQIHAAVYLFSKNQYPGAVTLALAAEDAMPEADDIYAFKAVQAIDNEMAKAINQLKNWLKHKKDVDEINIREFEVVLALDRAISKYIAVYHEITPDMRGHFKWKAVHGYV